MPAKPEQTPVQQDITEDVMHEFKAGDLKSGSGQKVRNRKQAIAIALSEAGASRDNTPAQNRRNLKRTQHKKEERT
jgi:hypothetical protein